MKTVKHAILPVIMILCLAGYISIAARPAADATCDAVLKILKDADNSFANIKGAVKDAAVSSTWFASKVTLPGAEEDGLELEEGISSYYEAKFKKTKVLEEAKQQLAGYQARLTACLKADGYVPTLSRNHDNIPGADDVTFAVINNQTPKELDHFIRLVLEKNLTGTQYGIVIRIYENAQ